MAGMLLAQKQAVSHSRAMMLIVIAGFFYDELELSGTVTATYIIMLPIELGQSCDD